MVNLILLLFIIGSSNVRELGNKGIEISFSMDKFKRQDYSFPEAVWLSNAGEPDLPSLIYKVGIPQNGDIEVRIVENREEVIRNATIEPVIYPVIYEPPLPESVKIHSKVYEENGFFPQDLIEISKPAYYRDIYTVEIRLNPIRYNPVTKELKLSNNIKINIRFKGKPVEKPIIDTSFEEIYKRIIVNYGQCKAWRREPEGTVGNPFSPGVWFKIEVDEEGIFRIGYDEIEEAGLDPGQFNPKTMKIYTATFDLLPANVVDPFEDSLIEIPVYVQGEDDQKFDKDDYLIFYGFPANHFVPVVSDSDTTIGWFENGYARNNVYWFTFGGDYGKRMEKVNAAWGGETPDTLVNEILHFEEDVSNPTRSGTNWYWLDMSPGDGPSGSSLVILHHPNANGKARITVAVFTLAPGKFIWQFSLDGEVFFRKDTFLLAHSSWPPHYLTGDATVYGDSSELLIEVIRPSGTTVNYTVYLNSVDMEYERLTNIDQPFHAFYQNQLNYSIKCSNVSSTPFALDVTNSKESSMFHNYTIDNNNMMLSSSSDSFQVLYFSKYSLTKPVHLIQSEPGKLRTQSAGCEYLYITHKDFYTTIMPLVDYRRKDYTTKIVVIDDIYNDFSFGKYDPLAIKHFLYYTTNNWSTVPKYVFLIGDATYDYKNNLGKSNPPNFIPMYESGTQISGNPGIPPNFIYEGEYVNFGVGEVMVLGRITVRTRNEVRDFIDKLMTYETKNIDGIWNKRMIFAGDDEYSTNWEGPDAFCGACERVIAETPDTLYDIVKLYMVSYPPFSYPCKKPNAEEAFIRELSKGGYAGLYLGHGNTFSLAHEGLLYDTDISRIKNSRKNFFYYFGSCTVNRFDDSDYECIGELFVRIKDGAIGTVGATRGTGGLGNENLGKRLFKLITDTDTILTMGECFLTAKLTSGGSSREYLLLGDPATNLRRVMNPMEISTDTKGVRPLEKLNITADEDRYHLKAFVHDTTHIKYFDATTADKISGHVYRMVQSGENTWVPFDYKIDGKEIYVGFWDDDTATIIAPNVGTTHLPTIKLSSFINQKSDMLDSIRVYGTAASSTDEIGPEVIFYDGARELKDGDWVDQEFTLTGRVSDESGINLINSVESTRGFYLYINADIENKIDLRDYFIYDRNSYTSGEFNIEIVLPESVDTLTVNVMDNCYNQTTKTIILNAEIYGRISIDNFLIYPNPLRNNKGMWFTFNLSNSGLVDIKIFTIAGRLIKMVDNVSCHAGYNQIYWNARDEYEDEISNGVYLVKAFVCAENAKDEVVEKFIIAR